MNNLTLRILTALVGVTVIIGSIFLDAWAFTIVFTLISLLTHYEYIRTTSQATNKSPRIIIVFALLTGLFIIQLLHPFIADPFNNSHTLFLLILPIALIMELYFNRDAPFQQVGLFALGVLYIPYIFGLFIATTLSTGTWFALGVLCMVWCNDTFAYFAGRWMGKHKLFERISPKKTWEGFFGGMVMTIVCGFVFSQMYNAVLSPLEWMALGLIVSISGTYGDLAESLLKRSIHIKDSGSLLPGHGGFLDRFDGFLLAVPCAVVFVELVR